MTWPMTRLRRRLTTWPGTWIRIRRAARHGLAPVAAAAVLLPAGLSGCTLPPLPGSPPDGPWFEVSAEFTDVLDLVELAAVKVNDVSVGRVEQVSLDGWNAVVRMRVEDSVRLPGNATAAVRQSSLLGEKFVALGPPTAEPAGGELRDGDVIPLERTRRTAEVEEVLSALGLLLSGGGLAHLKTINAEVAEALIGREEQAASALRQLEAFLAGLDDQRDDIVAAIEALDRLSARLAGQRQIIGDAVDALDPGLTTLANQQEQLTAALVALDELAKVGVRVIEESRDDTLASLRALEPLLEELVRAGDNLPRALDFMATFPFPPNVTDAIVGDQVNLQVSVDLDAATALANLLAASADEQELPAGSGSSPPQDSPQPDDDLLPELPDPSLPLPEPTLSPTPLPSLPPILPTDGTMSDDSTGDSALFRLLSGGLL